MSRLRCRDLKCNYCNEEGLFKFQLQSSFTSLNILFIIYVFFLIIFRLVAGLHKELLSNDLTFEEASIVYRDDPRSWLVKKRALSVSLPDDAYHVEPQTAFISTYISTGLISRDKWAEEELERKCREAQSLGDGRNAQVYRDAWYLGRYVGADRLSEGEVKEALLHAYTVNELVKHRKGGRADVMRSIENGIREGRLNPKPLTYQRPSSSRGHRPAAKARQLDLPPTAPPPPSTDEEIEERVAQLINDAEI